MGDTLPTPYGYKNVFRRKTYLNSSLFIFHHSLKKGSFEPFLFYFLFKIIKNRVGKKRRYGYIKPIAKFF